MRLIINADDLGYSHRVNAAIFDLLAKGRLTSATIMMNGPAVREALQEARNYPQASFGVHLNITEFSPLSTAALDPILDSHGEFRPKEAHPSYDARLCTAILQEWRVQVRHALESGLPISHLDSHHHVHTSPRLFWVLKRLQADFGIERVRLTKNLYHDRERPAGPTLLAKMIWNASLRLLAPRTRTTEAFTSFQAFYELSKRRNSWPDRIELMCHPGAAAFAEETSHLEEAVFDHKTTLISYNEI